MKTESVDTEPADRLGPSPPWKWIYTSVAVYTVVLILLLYWLTRWFDYSGK
ncbi:MAG: hypothetical protein ACE5JX_23210 [Acidobacteriota bacterium]